jgi:predicted Zn-dependent peptidase
LLSELLFIDQYQLPSSYLTDYVANTNAVTPEQVLSAARTAWQPAILSLVIVGDLAKIKAPLMALQELQGMDFHSPGMEQQL